MNNLAMESSGKNHLPGERIVIQGRVESINWMEQANMEKKKAKHKEKLTSMLAVHAKVLERRAVMAATLNPKLQDPDSIYDNKGLALKTDTHLAEALCLKSKEQV
ncbi:unnamed protein product [Sphagnum troendelagicum]|uniref:Uncharacterized protein n=1 Tax=Sphagnum troendelagicum TaxID=128251 RepID=A0ABP0T7F1_9BRYO